MKGKRIGSKLLLLALFSSLVCGSPIWEQNGRSDDEQIATENGIEEEGSKSGESEHTEAPVVEDQTTESSLRNADLRANSSLVLDTEPSVILPSENPAQGENETATQLPAIETEKYSQEVQISNRTKFQPTILEDTSQNTEDNLIADIILNNVTEVDSSTDVIPVVSDLSGNDEGKILEVITEADADVLDVQPITEFPNNFEEQTKGDAQVYEAYNFRNIEGDIEPVTEISTLDVTPIIEETTVLSSKKNEANEETLLTPSSSKEESQLSLLLKERLEKIQKKNEASDAQETFEMVELIDLNDRNEGQTEVTTPLGDYLEDTVEAEAQNGDQSTTKTTTHFSSEHALRDDDLEITTLNTIQVFDQRDLETTTQNVFEHGEDEATSDIIMVHRNSVDFLGQGDESDQTTTSPSDENSEMAELVKENYEPEVINQIYRSEIEELKNKLITSVRLEGSSSNINENVESMKPELTTEKYESTTLLNLSEHYEDTETTMSPDSFSKRDLTTEVNESQTERIESPSQEERNKNKGADYWLEMMGNRVNKVRNKTWPYDDKASEDGATNLREEESVTNSFTTVEDSTKALILSDEKETPHAVEFDVFVTTDNIGEAREAIEMTEIPSTESSQGNNGSDKGEKDKLTEEPVTMGLLNEEILLQEIEITTATPSEVELNEDDEHQITTQVTVFTVADLEKNEEETTTLSSSQVLKKLVPSKEVLDSNLKIEDLENTRVENETRTKTPILKTTGAQGEQESKPQETQKTSACENENEYLEASSITNQKKIPSKQKDENKGSMVEATSAKPQRIEQRLSHLAEKFGKLGLRPVFRRRAKFGPKRKRVDRQRYRKQLFKNF